MSKPWKKLAAVLLCALMVLSLTACASGQKGKAESSEETQGQGEEQTGSTGQEDVAGEGDAQEETASGQEDAEAPAEAAGHSGTEFAAQNNVDLTGNWAQKDAETSENYVAGYVSGDVIEVFFMTENGSRGSLYWSGTYVPQTTPGIPYSWDSVRDRSRAEQASMASDAETKNFSYANGELTFPVTLSGETKNVTMVRSMKDYSVFSGNSGTAFLVESGQPVEVEDRVFTWFTMEDGTCLLYYEMTLHNANRDIALRNSQIRVTVHGSDDAVLVTREQTVPAIDAGDTILFGDVFSYQGPEPANVEMIAFNDVNSYVNPEAASAPRQKDLPIADGLETIKDDTAVYTGKVTNESGKDLEAVRISVIFRKGDAIVGGLGDIVEGLRNGETKSFEFAEGRSLPDHDSFEIVAHAWDPQVVHSETP